MTLGEVLVLPDRKIRREDLLDADALILRSKTRVDARLVSGTSVRFVGTATAGFDHIDGSALNQAGIAWTAAPGCNANSVAEYVAAALLRMSRRHAWPLAGRTLGLIGVGQVGRRVAQKATALGMRVLLNDPPRKLAEPENADLLPLADILPQCDVVSLHVPLSEDPPFATRTMAGIRFFEQLNPGAWFINASRGEVVDEQALRLALDAETVPHAVLDVWNLEPRIDPALVKRADLSTPHIAGYSIDGKLKGTLQVYEEACRFFECPATWNPAKGESLPPPPDLRFNPAGQEDEASLDDIVRLVYDIEQDDAALRSAAGQGADILATEFERLRKTYPNRREFYNIQVRLTGSHRTLETSLCGLGFRVQPHP